MQTLTLRQFALLVPLTLVWGLNWPVMKLGVALLLWHEFTHLAGRPGYVALALMAAATWALGTQLLRHTRIALPTLTLSFWMTALTAIVMTLLSLLFERPLWLGETVYWQDWTAVVLMMIAIASVLWPARTGPELKRP